MLSIMIKKQIRSNGLIRALERSIKIIGFILIWNQQDTEFENVRSLLSMFFKHVL